MPFATSINGLFNNMWCYLVIAFFDWKIGVFQQTVVTVYCILNYDNKIDDNKIIIKLKMKNYNAILTEKQEKYHIVLNYDNKIDDNKIMMKLKMKNYNTILRY